MILFPAVDLFGGKAVRLYKGDYAQMTVYNPDPCAVAADFVRCGATAAHLVDLEGAKSGETPNFETVKAIKQSSGLFCEIGGGIRDRATVEAYLSVGLDRVILGTAAVRDPAFLEVCVRDYGECIAVGVDLRDGYVSVQGWTETSDLTADTFFSRLQAVGVQTVICTDISRDGAMRGTNRALYAELSKKYAMQITASGGVSSMDDVTALHDLGMYGAIIGKAYYTGDIDLAQAVRVCRLNKKESERNNQYP